LGLNLKYEFGGSARQINAEKSAAEQKLRALELDRIKLSLERDLNRVRESLNFLDHATAKAKKLTRLQKRKAELFNKDFANGRGGIQDLVEAQINYLNSLQRALEFSYNQSLSQIDKYSLVGESFEKFN
jgi:Mg2+ and Co2+ transporter CorA